MAYTYTGNPNQRIEQAKRRISNEQSVELNPTLLAYQQAYEQQTQEAIAQASEASVGKRVVDTLGDIGKSVLDGLLKAGEGLVDFGASTIGVFAGLAGNNDLKEDMSNFAARDLVGEMWNEGRKNGLNVDLKDSYIYDMSETGQNIVRGVGQGVGQMLPMVALTAITAGAGSAAAAAGKISSTAAQRIAKAAQVANLAGLGMSAAGTSTEQALNTEITDVNGNVTHPTLDRAYLYGLASGAVEVATEKLVGGVFDKVTGTGVADKLISKLSKSAKFSKAVEFGLNVVGEGVEEMVSEAVGNTLETIYTSSDGKMHWEDPNIEDVFISGVVGSLTAAVMGGAEIGVRKMSNVQSAQDAFLDYENAQKKADNLSRQGKLDSSAIDQLDAESNKSLESISRHYQRASEKNRQKILQSIPALNELLNTEDGTVRKMALNEGVSEITAEQASKAMSGSLAVSRRAEIANSLKNQNLELASNLDSTQQQNMKTLEKALSLTGKKTGVNAKVVVAENMADNAHLDGDIMYISKDRLSSSETVAQDFAHEAFHFSENTEEYRKMVKFFGSIKVNGESLINTAIDKVRNLGYDVDDDIFEIIKNRESVSGKDAVQVRLAFSEINAKAAELLFGDAETVEKLVNRDRSLARKVLSNIRDYAKIIESTFKGDSAAVETLKKMRQGIKLFEDALASSGEDYLRKKAVDRLANQNSNRNEFNTLAMQWAFSDKTQVGERTIRYRKDGAVIIEKTENGYIEVASPKNKNYKDIWSEINEHNDTIRNQSVYESAESYEFERRNGSRDNVVDGRRDGQSGRNGRVYQEQSGRNGDGTYQQSTGNQSEIKESRRGYAGRNPADITEQEYNHHYWAVANDVLSEQESGMLRSLVGSINQGDYCPKTKDGKYMVAVGEKGVLNKIVFTDGGKESYSIEKVIRINLDNETDLDYERGNIYYAESIGVLSETSSTRIIEVYNGNDYVFDEFARKRSQGRRNSNVEQDGRRSSTETENRTGNKVKHSLREVLSKEQSFALEKRGITGDDYLNAQDLAQEILSVNGVITADAKVVLYHATTKTNAESIKKSGKMYGKEPALYFSTKKDGIILDYGDSVVETKIPLEKLQINDVFNDEIHLTMDVRPFTPTNIRFSLRETVNFLNSIDSIEIADRDNDTYFVRCLNKDGSVEYEATLSERQMENRFGKEFADSIETDAMRNGGDILTIDSKTLAYYKDEYLPKPLDSKKVIQKAKEHFGTTYFARLAGYINTDGTMLDFSQGSGHRAIDHREIADILDGYDGTDALIEYMSIGNIRINPEYPGINLQIEPTEAQYNRIQSIVEALGWKEKSFVVDFDNANGDTIDTLTYDGNVSARKVIADIKYYFKEGEVPYQSDFAKYRYSLRGDGKEKVVVIDTGQSLFEGLKKSEYAEIAREYMKEKYRGQTIDGVKFTRRSENEYTFSDATQILSKQDPETYKKKMRAVTELVNFVKAGTLISHEDAKHPKGFNAGGYNRYSVDFIIDKNRFNGELLVAIDGNGKGIFYDIVKIKKNGSTIGVYSEGMETVYNNNILQNSEKSTSGDNISYSLREKPSFGDKKTKTELLKRIEGMQLDFYGQYFAANKNAADYFGEDALGETLANQIVLMANDSSESNRYAYANDLAEHIIDNMAITNVDPSVLSELTRDADLIRSYKRKLDLSGIMDEIKSRYDDKATTIRLQWGANKNAPHAMSIDDAIMQLRSDGVIIESDVIADAFFEMLDIVDEANKQTQKTLYTTAREALSKEEFTYLQEEIRDDILSFMEEKGTQQEWNKYFGNIKKEAKTYYDKVMQRAEENAKNEALQAKINAEKAKHIYDDKTRAMEQELQERTQKLQIEAADAIEYNAERHRLIDKVWSEAVSLSKDNLKKYNNASDLMNQEFASVIKRLSGIKYRGELKKGATRRIISDFGKWYNINNPLLTGGLDADTINTMMNDASVSTIGYLDKFTLQAIETIQDNPTVESKGGKTKGQQIANNQPLTTNELKLAQAILGSARHVLKNYNTVQIKNKNLVLSETATKANNQAKAIAPHVKKRTRLGEKASQWIKSIIDPSALIGEMFGYQEDSPLVDAFNDIQDGSTHAAYTTNQFTDIIENFIKENKHYKKHLVDKIKVGNREIRVDVALSLYMLSQQADSINGLKNGGWGYRDDKGYWIDCGTLTDSDIKTLKGQFSDADNKFIEIVRKFFNTTGKVLAETDMNYKGYTLIDTDENSQYFPIVRYSGDMAKSVADVEVSKNIASVSVANYSFTKERVKNERRITVVPILDVVNKHAREVGNYVGLAIPIKEFQRLYNANIGGNGKTVSIRNTINEHAWSGFNEYITTLLNDIQGVGRNSGGLANRALNMVTSHIATNALGFNLKTILSQISGYPAIYMNVSLESMTKAFAHSTWYKSDNAANMLKYSEWAAVKAHDNGLILAETGAQKLGKIANFTTLGIQMMDNAMNRLIWNACQCEIEKRTGLKFGTVENMIEAGKLHSEVGRATQGNNARSELSAMQRSNNALAKMYSMFNSDGFKYISRLYESVKKVSAYKYLNKVNPGTISQQKIKSSHAFVAKAATAVIASNLVYCLMGQLMKFALNKEREDKDGNEIGFWQDLGMDFMGSMAGMIPIIRDIYSYLVEGYEVKDNATEGIMNLSKAIKDVIESIATVAKGDVYDSSDIAKPLKSLFDAVGLCTGLPTRNVYNYVYGFTKRFSPSTAYEWNSLFYNNGYTKDLKKAIEKDDVDLQKTIIGLMLKDDGMTDTSAKVNERLRELYKQGYTVLPKSVKDTLHYEGETYNLSKCQQNAFKAIYGKANDEVEELVESRSFSTLSTEIQAKAIKWIYDYYYESAVYNTIGEEADSKKQLFGEVMSISKFAMTISACRAIESKLDRKGNVIAGSKKQEILRLLKSLRLSTNEQLMVLAYLGYSVSDDERLIKNFVSRIGLSKSQQKSLLKYCGIAV